MAHTAGGEKRRLGNACALVSEPSLLILDEPMTGLDAFMAPIFTDHNSWLTVPCAAGGEKRRLGIACALVSKPSLLFLDEPTTGLDAFAALNIMDHMSCLTALGHTIVASIHQPRAAIWDMLHKVGLANASFQCLLLCTVVAHISIASVGHVP